jgi:hypothetical protein
VAPVGNKLNAIVHGAKTARTLLNPLNNPAILIAKAADCYLGFRNVVMPFSIHCYAAPCSLYIGANEEIQKPFICSARSFRS